MFAFVFEILIFASLAIILVLMMRALPKVADEVFVGSRSFIKTHEFMLILEQVDNTLKNLMEKLLRRVKIILLKFDTVITKKITKLNNERMKEKVTFAPLVMPPQDEKNEAELVSYNFVKTIPVEEKVVEGGKKIKKPRKSIRKKVAL